MIESRALGGPLLESASSKNGRSLFVGFETSTPQATMVPDLPTLYGLRRPSAIVWKPGHPTHRLTRTVGGDVRALRGRTVGLRRDRRLTDDDRGRAGGGGVRSRDRGDRGERAGASEAKASAAKPGRVPIAGIKTLEHPFPDRVSVPRNGA